LVYVSDLKNQDIICGKMIDGFKKLTNK